MTNEIDASAHDEWRIAAASYVIDALDAGEARAFEAHLTTCAACQADVASLRRLADGLSVAVDPIEPPSSLKARTIARATLPPMARIEPTPMRNAPSAMRMSFPSWGLVAASFTLAVGLGIYAMSLHTQMQSLRDLVSESAEQARALRVELADARRDSARLVRAVDVMGAPDLVRVELVGQPGAASSVGQAYWSRTRGLVFNAQGLPALAPGRVYQLWVLAPGPVSVGTLSLGANGQAAFTAPLPSDLPAVVAVAVTNEPGPQGSATPTPPILLIGQAHASGP